MGTGLSAPGFSHPLKCLPVRVKSRATVAEFFPALYRDIHVPGIDVYAVADALALLSGNQCRSQTPGTGRRPYLLAGCDSGSAGASPPQAFGFHDR